MLVWILLDFLGILDHDKNILLLVPQRKERNGRKVDNINNVKMVSRILFISQVIVSV